MEKKLESLFEFQKFAGNPELAKLIEETESRYAKALSDDDLALVNAAGDVAQAQREEKKDTEK